jgi:hypothetical protein
MWTCGQTWLPLVYYHLYLMGLCPLSQYTTPHSFSENADFRLWVN